MLPHNVLRELLASSSYVGRVTYPSQQPAWPLHVCTGFGARRVAEQRANEKKIRRLTCSELLPGGATLEVNQTGVPPQGQKKGVGKANGARENGNGH